MFRLRDKRGRRLQGRRRTTRRFTPGLETLEDRRVLASIIWDGGGSDHHWNNSANWFDVTNEVDGVLPTSDDDVVIRDQFAGITVLVDDDVTVNSLQSAAGLNINGNVDFALEAASQIDGPVQLAGRLGGSGTVTFTDSLLWTGGNMADDGTTVIDTGATLTIDGSVSISDGDSTVQPPRGRSTTSARSSGSSGNIHASFQRLTLHNRPGALFDVRTKRQYRPPQRPRTAPDQRGDAPQVGRRRDQHNPTCGCRTRAAWKSRRARWRYAHAAASVPAI
jgi:hypothetical protein